MTRRIRPTRSAVPARAGAVRAVVGAVVGAVVRAVVRAVVGSAVRAGLPAIALLALPATVRAQHSEASDPRLRRAMVAYDDLDYAGAVEGAHQALRDGLSAADQAHAYQVLGFAYASLDSARQATEALKQLILLDPERDLDPTRVSPKITSLYALALNEVLVVRHFAVDGAPFVAGTSGAVGFQFVVTRPALVRTRITGPGGSIVLDSAMRSGPVRIGWNGYGRTGRAVLPGEYRLVVEAWSGRDSYGTAYPVHVAASAVDTLAHLAALPGYSLLPEHVVPPRSVRPAAVAALAVAAVAAGTVALQPSALNGGDRRALIGVSGGTLLAGLLGALRRPAPVPSAANIRYNTLVHEQLARQNAEIAATNAARREQVRLSVVAEPGAGPTAAGGGGR